ncbi:hypothetical protein AAU61_06970 [Desulfocarbo indianensis]|nr:hypothetical protein AAU61_06970 [Desulfocarbo indianensis]
MDYAFLLKWLAAFSPIGVVLALMLGLNWGGGRAGAAGWFTAMLVAWGVFGADVDTLALAQTKGALLSLNVLYIIWAALLLYQVVKEAGAIKAIGAGIQRFSADPVIQMLIFGWVFGSFLQGVAGYGVPIAVVAPLLAGLGFAPVVAVAAPAIAHSWSVTFGSMGASFQALIAVTGLSAAQLAPWSAGMLGVAGFMCGAGSLHLYGGTAALAHGWLALLAVGGVMGLTQYLLAVGGMWTMAGFGASLAGVAACLAVARLSPYRKSTAAAEAASGMGLAWALSAYLILIAIVVPAEMIPLLKKWLGAIKLSLDFPAMVTDGGWRVAAGRGASISVFGHGGALLFYASCAGYAVYRLRGCYPSGAAGRILRETAKSALPTSLGIVSMVCFALVMDQAGMTYLLAEGLSKTFGGLFPLFSPWIGLLGAFMTGSNTNSNVVFAVLQQRTAELAGYSAAVILAAQTTGGALGSMVAPAKILVGCSTVGLGGQEGPVLRATITYGLLITMSMGLIALGAAWLLR